MEYFIPGVSRDVTVPWVTVGLAEQLLSNSEKPGLDKEPNLVSVVLKQFSKH